MIPDIKTSSYLLPNCEVWFVHAWDNNKSIGMYITREECKKEYPQLHSYESIKIIAKKRFNIHPDDENVSYFKMPMKS